MGYFVLSYFDIQERVSRFIAIYFYVNISYLLQHINNQNKNIGTTLTLDIKQVNVLYRAYPLGLKTAFSEERGEKWEM